MLDPLDPLDPFGDVPSVSLSASCDWGCPECELFCGILARTVRELGGELTEAVAAHALSPTDDHAREVDRLTEAHTRASFQFDRKRGVPIEAAGSRLVIPVGGSVH